jgi:hypothetical protein
VVPLVATLLTAFERALDKVLDFAVQITCAKCTQKFGVSHFLLHIHSDQPKYGKSQGYESDQS